MNGNENGGSRFIVTGKNVRRETRPVRKRPAHMPVVESFNKSLIVFLTVCADNKRKIFADPVVHDLFKMAWGQSNDWIVGRYVVMPNHVHLFCAPARHDYPSLSRWVQFWKTLISRQWPKPEEQPIWQRSFWDTQLRRHESYAQKWEYVRCNPVRAGLCESPEKWQFKGEMNVLMWHD